MLSQVAANPTLECADLPCEKLIDPAKISQHILKELTPRFENMEKRIDELEFELETVKCAKRELDEELSRSRNSRAELEDRVNYLEAITKQLGI